MYTQRKYFLLKESTDAIKRRRHKTHKKQERKTNPLVFPGQMTLNCVCKFIAICFFFSFLFFHSFLLKNVSAFLKTIICDY